MNIFVLAHEKIRDDLLALLKNVAGKSFSPELVAFTVGDFKSATELLPSGDYGLVIVGGTAQDAAYVFDGKDAIIDLRYKGITTPNVLVANARKCYYAEHFTKACDHTVDKDILASEYASFARSTDGPFPEMEKLVTLITLAMMRV